MTNEERDEALKVMTVAYEKGFGCGFEAGYQKAIDNMEELIKKNGVIEEKEGKEDGTEES